MQDSGRGTERRAGLTDLAADILLAPDDEPTRIQAIREAALGPQIHQELWDQFGRDLPSDSNLRYQLIRQRGFSESGADDLIGEYRRTLEFANLDGDDNITQTEPVKSEKAEDNMSPASSGQRDGDRVVYLPLLENRWAVLRADFPVTSKDWDQMIAILEAMRPGLVADPAKPVDIFSQFSSGAPLTESN